MFDDHTYDDMEFDWSMNERRMLKYMFETDGMMFMRYFFKLRENTKMLLNWHHYVIEFVLQLGGQSDRLGSFRLAQLPQS